MAMPCWAGGKASSRMDWLRGWSPPPPIPWMILKTIRLVRLQAEPQRKELAVKRVIDPMRYFFLPKNLLSQPVMGITIALDTR